MMQNQSHNLVPVDEVQVEIVSEFKFYTEGPAIDRVGNLFFTDLSGHTIWKYDGVELLEWGKGTRPNGQAIMNDGSHLLCDSEEAVVNQYDSLGNLIKKFDPDVIEGLPVRCPNDLCIDQGLGFYFTDSVRHDGAVFYVGFDGKQSLVSDHIDFANGIALSADRRRLMVAESYQNRILAIDLESPGEAKGTYSVFANLPVNQDDPETGNLPDGIRFDITGRLWVAHYGMQAVQVLSKSGELLSTYDTEIPLTSNLCFFGNDLFVTGGFNEPGPGRVSRMTVLQE